MEDWIFYQVSFDVWLSNESIETDFETVESFDLLNYSYLNFNTQNFPVI
jgi:hypothetical protein